MELYQLKIFVTVAKTGAVTKASEQLYLSQPAVSAQIKALAGVGQLDAVIEGDANTGHLQAVIGGLHPRGEYIRAPLAALAVAVPVVVEERAVGG